MKAATLYPSQCYLGESPVWHSARKSCLWVDIENGTLYELKLYSGAIQKWFLDMRVSVIIEHNDGDLILGVQGGIVKFSFNDGSVVWLTDIEKHLPNNRCNDGNCDIHGRIWVGIMDMNCLESAGSLFCVHDDLSIEKKMGGLTIPNGLLWSLDHKRMYFIDSPARNVRSYLFDSKTGEITYEKDSIIISSEMGVPDGMCIDEEGMLWVAQFGGSCVNRWDPQTGELLSNIELPVPHVTNCCFIGDNLDSLMITTSREHLNAGQLQKYHESGNVFIAENIGIKGVSNNKAKHK